VSLSVAYVSKITVVETLTGDFVDPANATVGFNGLDAAETLTGATTTPVTKHAEDSLALTAGAATINLAALPGKTPEEVVVGTGLKVQFAKFVNPATNANKITVAKGASNGYGLCASGDTWSHTLSPGQEVTFKGDDAAPDVASGARTIDVTGTGSQVLDYVIVMG
jgi:hypothetical protein